MARDWPALEVRGVGDPDLLLAIVDEYSPTAVEENDSAVRVFFATAGARDHALAAVAADPRFRTSAGAALAIEVSDEDWARRSQENLESVTVGRITIHPTPESPATTKPKSQTPNPDHLAIIIPPSIAFGTGHHATTRLCLAALQTLDLAGRFAIDIGTGSGVLALAAVALGACGALGLDHDGDAIAEARENLTRNARIRNVRFVQQDLRDGGIGEGDVVTANLTGALLASASGALVDAVAPGGHLIVSGLLPGESDAVIGSFGAKMKKVWQADEDGWTGVVLVKIN